ncbi:MAG: hypothetical protein RLZZ338_2047 [Cyanobacteriota bacterium]|jgi:predicted aspartyl protease
MINGKFGEIGELFFEIDLIAADRERFPIEVLLDTGFTTGWLALDTQDAESLGWCVIQRNETMQTARGLDFFDIATAKAIRTDFVGAGSPSSLNPKDKL